MIDRDFIFIHVPKTGGQSVEKALGGKSGNYSHAPLFSLKKNGRFAFGLMRNPWERLVSLYAFMCQKRMKSTDSFNQRQVREAGFKRWLMEGQFYMQEDGLPLGHAWKVRGNSDMLPMQRRPQMWWLEGCDFIGQFENLSVDVNRAMRLMGKPPVKLPHMNQTSHHHYSEYYDAESAAFVAEHFAPDIEQGHYAYSYRSQSGR